MVGRVVELAERKGVTPAQIALAWVMHQPGVAAPIVGATKMYQLEQAIGAVDIVFSAEECAYLEAPYMPHPVIGPER